MSTPRRLVQLFNAGHHRSRPDPAPDSAPNHLRFERELEAAGFAVETIPAYGWPWNPAARMHNAYLGLDPLRALKVLLTRRRAAIVCAHLESTLLILLLRRLCHFRPPIVIWEVPWSPGWAYRERVSRLAIPRADCSVVFSSSQIQLVRSVYGQHTPVVFLPFCIDVEFYRPLPKVPGVRPYILSCGMDPGRDFAILLDVSGAIPADITIKAGRTFAPNRSTPANVTITRDHMSYLRYRDLYAGAAIVVVTTHNTPNASGVTSLMEAMAMGKPVVVSDNPALRDYLPPPDAGVVIPVGDRAALQAAILGLLSDPAKAEKMGQAARAFALKNFHPKRHFQAVATLLNDVAASVKPTARSPRP